MISSVFTATSAGLPFPGHSTLPFDTV
jgi:hypothetical protein